VIVMVMSDKNGADVANVDAGFCDTARDAIPASMT